MNFIINETEQKLRGGYYTPIDLARFCVAWAIEGGACELIEPSCGDGAFIEALATPRWAKGLSLQAFELSPSEAAKARDRAARFGFGTGKISVTNTDFLGWAIKHMLRGIPIADSIVGNPPFIRYQYLPPEFQHRSEQIFELLRLPFTKHTNAWVPFILASIALIRPGGRLAMVIPSEIVHVMHAAPLRDYLAKTCDRIAIIDPTEIWFTETLQGAVILLAEKAETPARPKGQMSIIPVVGRDFTTRRAEEILHTAVWHNAKDIEGKWTRAAVPKAALAVLAEAAKRAEVRRLADIADVDVGIVTGANKFFLVTDDVVKEHQLEPWACPMFGRSEHCPGIVYDERQHRANALLGYPTNFLWFDSANGKPLHQKARAYVALGEQQELNKRYKCRIRDPWYQVPSVYATSLGMLKRSHDAPRLILNSAGAYSTDTSYRLTPHSHSPELLTCCFLTALTSLCAEVEGRYYGGGVLELVPSEIERLLICVPKNWKPDVATLDQTVRDNGIMTAIIQQTERVLGAAGFTGQEQHMLVDAWHQLRARRQRLDAADTGTND